jgi:hypothetical protein
VCATDAPEVGIYTKIPHDIAAHLFVVSSDYAVLKLGLIGLKSCMHVLHDPAPLVCSCATITLPTAPMNSESSAWTITSTSFPSPDTLRTFCSPWTSLFSVLSTVIVLLPSMTGPPMLETRKSRRILVTVKWRAFKYCITVYSTRAYLGKKMAIPMQ